MTQLPLEALDLSKEHQVVRSGPTRGQHRTTQGAVRLEGEPHRARSCHVLIQPLQYPAEQRVSGHQLRRAALAYKEKKYDELAAKMTDQNEGVQTQLLYPKGK